MIDNFISADSHVVEPAICGPPGWTAFSRPRPTFRARRARGPLGSRRPQQPADRLFGPMVSEKAQGGLTSAARSGATKTPGPGAYNPEARLADQRLDHVRAEIVLSGTLSYSFWHP